MAKLLSLGSDFVQFSLTIVAKGYQHFHRMFILDNFGVGLLTFRFRICTRAGTPLEAFLACGLIARSAMDVKKLT